MPELKSLDMLRENGLLQEKRRDVVSKDSTIRVVSSDKVEPRDILTKLKPHAGRFNEGLKFCRICGTWLNCTYCHLLNGSLSSSSHL